MKVNSNYITKAASLLTIAVGLLVLAGWVFNIAAFKSVMPGIISMKFNTAVCFILSGIALYLLDAPDISQRRKTVAFICAWIVLIAGLLNLSEYIFSRNIGIDELLWKEGPGTAATIFPGRMSLTTSINFILLGFIFLTLGKRKYYWLIQALLIVIIPGSLLTIFNHLIGISFLNSIPQLTNTALHTAILFIVLCRGVFCSSPLGYIRFSFQKKIAGFFTLVFVVLSIIFFAFYENNEHAADTANSAVHANEVFLESDQIFDDVFDMENGIRDFVISGREEYLTPFNSGTALINNAVLKLKELTKNNPPQNARIDSLQILIEKYIESRYFIIQARKKGGIEAANIIIEEGKKKNIFDQLKSAHASIMKEENQLLIKHKVENEQNFQNSSRVINIFQFVTGLLLLITLLVIYKNTRLRNKAEEALQNTLKEVSDYKYALDESSIVAITDHKGIIRQVNDNFCKISKYKREELIGQDHRIINSGFHPKEFIRDLWVTIANGKVWRGELKNKGKDGTVYWVDTTIVPFLNEQGKPYQYVAIRADITERKELEEQIWQMNQDLEKKVEEKTNELLQAEVHFRNILDNLMEGTAILGFDWRFKYMNDTFVRHANYCREEISGYALMEKYPGVEQTELFKVYQRCMNERVSVQLENEFTFPDGTTGWFDLSIQPVPEGIFILKTDITERKKAEEKLKESNERYEFVNKATHDTIWEWNYLTKEGQWGEGIINIFGYTGDKMKYDENWVDEFVHPEDKERIFKKIQGRIENNSQSCQIEYRFRCADGTYKEVFDRGYILYDGNSKPCRMFGAITDLTEKKRLERKLVEQQMRQQILITETTLLAQEKERNELGRELHDNINQILATVKMYLGVAKSGQYIQEDIIGKSYKYVNEAMEEIRKLSHSLVAPSLGDMGLKVALQELVEDTNLLNGLQVQLLVDEKYNEKEIDKCKELMFYRIVQEQLNNITKYAKAKTAVIAVKADNGNLFLSVADNGMGFDTSQKAKGIGLKNIRNRVEFYSGNMNIISAPGKGCTIEVYIPR